ncbi:MAG: hypothetical protein O7C66_04885 [Alphaproteobacteria bacterium]|nr:hypothetical protein [Alphaproteobacteria bacterium]
MFRKALLPLCLAGVLATLAACSGPAIYFTDIDTAYTRSEVLYATKGGPLPVEAIGQVTFEETLRGQALEQTVVRALSRFGPHWFAAGFTAGKDADPAPYYRVRWLFNPPVNFPYYTACAKDLGVQSRAWGEETGLVIAAFCRGTRLLSAARGSYGRPADADPAAFPRFIGIMGLVLMPLRNPDRGNDCRPRVICN